MQANNQLTEAFETFFKQLPELSLKDYPFICQQLAQFEKDGREAGYSGSMLNDARFFICSFLDAQITFETPLLSTFFSESQRADDFFQRLTRRQEDIEKNRELLELAYLCLSLGYPGKQLTEQQRSIVIDDLYYDLRDVEKSPSHRLGLGKRAKIKKTGWLPPIWLTVIVGVVISLSIYIPYQHKLNRSIGNALDALQSMNTKSNGSET